MTVTATNCTITVKRNGEAIESGASIRDGEKLTITAEADEGAEMSALTVNGESISSGDEITVEGDVVIVGTAA